MAAIFKSDTATAMPLLKERLEALHEAGQVLVEVGDLNLKRLQVSLFKTIIVVSLYIVGSFVGLFLHYYHFIVVVGRA